MQPVLSRPTQIIADSLCQVGQLQYRMFCIHGYASTQFRESVFLNWRLPFILQFEISYASVQFSRYNFLIDMTNIPFHTTYFSGLNKFHIVITGKQIAKYWTWCISYDYTWSIFQSWSPHFQKNATRAPHAIYFDFMLGITSYAIGVQRIPILTELMLKAMTQTDTCNCAL